MKKILIFLVIVVTIGAMQYGALPVTAMEVGVDGVKWYSASELVERWREEKDIRDEKCNKNVECERELWDEKMRDKEYKVLNNFLSQFIYVTDINPGKGTIKIVFFGDRIFSGTSYRINRLRVAWADDGRDNLAANLTKFFANESIVIFYDGSEENNGREWIPKGEQVELTTTNEIRLSDNTGGILHLGADGGGFSVNVRVDYTNCLNDSRYREGMNCQMWYSSEREIQYRLEIVDTEGDSGDMENGGGGATDVMDTTTDDSIEYGDIGYDSEDITEEYIEDGEEVIIKHEMTRQTDVTKDYDDEVKGVRNDEGGILTNNNQKETKDETKEAQKLVEKESNFNETQYVDPKMENLEVELPDLGGINCEKEVNFPWWFLLILAAGDVVLVWLWTPKKEER